jgi:Nif-specific regulatory protein
MLANLKDSDLCAPTRAALIERELETLYRVSAVLSRSLDLDDTLQGVLQVLHDHGGMRHGMVTLLDPATGELLLSAVHPKNGQGSVGRIRYRPGEGLVGTILEHRTLVVVERIADEPRFLDRLGLYDRELPFIAVPILLKQGDPVGVLAAQPPLTRDPLLAERARFLEMVANLITQSVRLARDVQRKHHDLAEERDRLHRTVRGCFGFQNVVGHTPAMRRLFDQVHQVAKWDTTVLICGESGTGKELIANAIHYNSPRVNGPFVKLNCAALPDSLLESELFGHEKGAFTGAVTERKGRFEQAHGGTLFLDEIGDISPVFQAKLLRVLQEGEFERVGASRSLRVDVRVLAATNRDLETEVADGRFREDLYYRVNVMPLFLPPLRERREDISDLARFLVGQLAKRQGRPLEITDSGIRLLMRYAWPGNVRELENCLERAAIMSEVGVIDREALDMAGLDEMVMVSGRSAVPPDVNLDDPNMDERERVIAALEQAGWVQAKAARLLGMTPRQIAYRIQTLNIKVRRL